MTVTVKNKTPLIVPPSVRRRAGLKPGDKIEFRASGGIITIRPSTSVLVDEYTPTQRRAILADAKAGLKEIAQGEGYGPFETGAELRTFVESAIAKEEGRKPKRKVKQS